MQQRRSLLATGGVAVVLFLLASVCTLAAAQASHASGQAGRFLSLERSYQRVSDAVQAQQEAQRDYLDAPRGYLRADYDNGGTALRLGANRVRQLGGTSDKALASYILIVDRRYESAAVKVFAAVDAGDITTARTLERTQTRPAADNLAHLVNTASQV